VADSAGKPTCIPCLEPFEAQCTLGVHLTPDRNSQVVFNYLHSVAKDWQIKMANAKLTHNDAQFSIRGKILRKLIYPLATSYYLHCQTMQYYYET